MFSLLCRRENAHSGAVWSCDWKVSHSPVMINKFNMKNKSDHSDNQHRSSVDCIATGSNDGTVKIWSYDNLQSLRLMTTITESVDPLFAGGVLAVALNADASIVASSTLYATLTLNKTINGNIAQLFKIPNVEYWNLAYAPDNSFIACGNYIGHILIYSVFDGVLEQLIKTRLGFVKSIAYSPNGKYLACADSSGKIALIDVEMGRVIRTLINMHSGEVGSLCFSPDSKYFLTGSFDKTVKLHAANTNSLIKQITDHTESVNCVDFSPNNKNFISGGCDNTVKIWDAANFRCLDTLLHQDEVKDIKYNSTGDKIMSVTGEGSINIYAKA